MGASLSMVQPKSDDGSTILLQVLALYRVRPRCTETANNGIRCA
jgi:hypothetical protein